MARLSDMLALALVLPTLSLVSLETSAIEPLPPGSVEITVVEAATRAEIPSWGLRVECECLPRPLDVVSDEDGHVLLTDLPAGRFRVVDARERPSTRARRAPALVEVVVDDDARRGIRTRAPVSIDEPERFSAGTLTWAGVGVVSIGATLITGGVLAGTMDRCNHDGATPVDCTKDLRTGWSLGLAAAGVATVGAGAAMIGVGRKRRLALGPTMAFRRGGGVVGLRGRF